TNAPAGSRVIPEPTRSDLLMIDPDITRLEQQLIATRATIEAHVRKFRDPNHPVRVEDREIEQTLLDELDERMQAARGQWVANGGRIRPEADGAFMRTEREQRLGRLRAVQVRQQAQLDKYYTMRATLSEFQQRVDDLTRDIRIVDDRIKALDVPPDLTFSGQIKIHEGMRPLLPSRDKRRQMMVAGVFGGFGLSLGFFFLWGMIDRRAFSVSQLDSPAHAYRLLGILPHLKMTSEFDDDRDAAAQCVHQIRNRLEAVRNRESSTVIAVCSAFAEDGKTNLTMLLGWSFAAAGHRTLLVDADFVGRSLSRRTGTLESAGLREVLSRKWLDDEVRPLSAGNLTVLAAGRLESFGPEQIRVDDFEMLATELRAQFDIILIDTGPFVGGVEVLPLCAAADGVVFVVRRGRSRNRLDSCIDELRITSTPCFGVVLNRAAPEDCARYVSGSSGASGKGRRAATPSTLPVAMGPVNGRQSSVVCTIETRSLRDLDSTPGADS
ncbi:MAG: hypothetical protein KDB80_11710, partial [Planctomycetes bacterium]|nr:hypothetical protein [Planctomycetota bacterium]